MGGGADAVCVGDTVEQGPERRHGSDDLRCVTRCEPDHFADGQRRYWVAECGHEVHAAWLQHRIEPFGDDPGHGRIQASHRGGAELRLEQPAVPGVQRRIGRGQHVNRVAEASHGVRHRTAGAVVVKDAHQVGGEVLGSTDGLADQGRVGHEEGVLAGDLPDGCFAPQQVVEGAGILQHVRSQ